MDTPRYDDMEEAYARQLKKDFVAQLKGRVKKLSHEDLRERILQFLQANVICTLATCSDNVPRSTIVRYRSRGLTVYIVTEGGGKIKNIRHNPLVSLSICGEYTGFQSVTGLQAWGQAEIISPEDREKYEAMRKLVDPGDREDLKKVDLKKIPDMHIIKIDITRARFLSFPEGILNQTLTVET